MHETFEVEPSRSLSWMDDTASVKRECRLVVIGRHLDEEAIRKGFKALAVK